MPTTFDWDSMQSFLAIARAGRLTVAAQRLGIDHTTLSRRIKDLEAALQTRLFDRSVGGYVLTSQGERFLESAQAVETLALEVLRDVAGSSSKPAPFFDFKLGLVITDRDSLRSSKICAPKARRCSTPRMGQPGSSA